MRSFHLFLALAAVLTSWVPSLLAAPSVPEWLKNIAAQPSPTYDKKIKVAVLFDDTVVDLKPDGRQIITRRVAMRLLQPEGQDQLGLVLPFDAQSDKVLKAHAWMIPRAGKPKGYEKKDFVEVAQGGDLFSHRRVLLLNTRDDGQVGSTFGYETSVSEKTIFAQLYFSLQDEHPVEARRIEIVLPAGWDLETVFFNSDRTEAGVQGQRRVWTFPATPALPDEPRAPGLKGRLAAFGVTLAAPPKVYAGGKYNPPFRTWAEVSHFTSRIQDPQCIVDPTITAKAAALVKGCTTPWEKMAALAACAQQVNYAAISLDLSKAGGYRPHASTLTLQRNYGDCKDKANLLRALLRTQGIESYPIAICSGDNTGVDPAWPSPYWFNHAILAIKVDADVTTPAVFDHPKFGRLLFFDPTDPHVPFGELPRGQYGSRVLIEAGDAGELFALPPPPSTPRSEGRIEATLDDKGALTARRHVTAYGDDAVNLRRLVRGLSPAAFQQRHLRAVNYFVRNAKVTGIKTTDSFAENRGTLEYTFSSPSHAQSLRGELLIFKPFLVARDDDPRFDDEKRTLPIVFTAEHFSESATFTLPETFAVDELPPAVKLTSAFGEYRTSARVDGKKLHVERTLIIRDTEVPAADYEAVRKFFRDFVKAEQATVVLKRATTSAAK